MKRDTLGLPKVAYGRGSYVFDEAGNRYIDGSGGPAVFCLGHAHPEVNEAIRVQLGRIAHGYRFTFTSDPLERLVEIIQQQAGPGFEHAVFVSSGSEATESGLKIALQHFWARGEASRNRFIARDRSYHGNTLGALAVSGFASRREPFEQALRETAFVSAANAYRKPAGISVEDYVQQLADELEQTIVELGAQNVAGFLFEPVVGAAGGVVPAPAGYAKKVRDICDRHGILLIADEVMCGAGRCGTWRALEHDGVVPDIMMLAKGLGGGYVPLGATMFSAAVGEPIHANGGSVNTGHTFTGHTLACAAAVKVQEIIERDRLVERVRTRGHSFISELRDRLADTDAVGDIRGRGFFVGVELVKDRGTRTPFPARAELRERIRRHTMQEGLICYPVGGNVDGRSGDVAILAPPYNASDKELDEIAGKFERGLRRALADVR
ncbi:MAG: aspartate aminotransferase family protein [Gammaproteobacteria bacterium]|nr:aspartate aminotransferase family protein [Gammaproteobacteria bacterium]